MDHRSLTTCGIRQHRFERNQIPLHAALPLWPYSTKAKDTVEITR